VVYFAQRTQADGFFTVGFLDDTCAPTTVYTAYNAVRGQKDIYNDLYARHENTPEAVRRMREAVLRTVQEMREPGAWRARLLAWSPSQAVPAASAAPASSQLAALRAVTSFW